MRLPSGCSVLTHRLAHSSWGWNFGGEPKSALFFVSGLPSFPYSRIGGGIGGT